MEPIRLQSTSVLLVLENVNYISTVCLIEPKIQIFQSPFLFVYHKIIHKNCHHSTVFFYFIKCFSSNCHILQNTTTVFSNKHGL